jgi:hypothetical protein
MLEPLAEYERELIVEGVNAGISRMSGDNRPGHRSVTPTSVDNIIEIPADSRRPLQPV